MNGSVLIRWTDSSMGWKTSKRRVKVIDENAKTLVTALSRNNQNELLVSNLEADQSYELIFAPEGPNIPDFIQEFSTILALLPDEEDKNAPHRSFISSVNLKTSIIYSGQLRAFWDQAKAILQDEQGTIASTIGKSIF